MQIAVRVAGGQWFSTNITPEQYILLLSGILINGLPFSEVLIEEIELPEESEHTYVRIVYNLISKSWSHEYE